MHASVNMGTEFDALIGDLTEFGQTKSLISPAVRQDGFIPIHKFMQAAGVLDDIRPRTKIQMIGIGKHDLGLHVMKVSARHGLDRGCRGHRHKKRRLDLAMRGRD